MYSVLCLLLIHFQFYLNKNWRSIFFSFILSMSLDITDGIKMSLYVFMIFHIILPTLPHFRMISWTEERDGWKGMRGEEDKEEVKTFYLSQENKIILTGTEITHCWLKTSKSISLMAITLESVLYVWLLIVWHFKWYIEAYKM